MPPPTPAAQNVCTHLHVLCCYHGPLPPQALLTPWCPASLPLPLLPTALSGRMLVEGDLTQVGAELPRPQVDNGEPPLVHQMCLGSLSVGTDVAARTVDMGAWPSSCVFSVQRMPPPLPVQPLAALCAPSPLLLQPHCRHRRT